MFQFQNLCNSVKFVLIFLLFSSIQSLKAQGIQTLAPNYLRIPEKEFEVNILWKGDSVNGTWEAHSALLLPVTLPGCPKQFYMQFDLGAPSTIFYKSSLQEIQSKYPRLKMNINSSDMLSDFRFLVGTTPVLADSAKVIGYQNTLIDWKNKKSIDIIGTIGGDFIENRFVIFDFRSDRLINGTELSKEIQETVKFTDFMYIQRTVLLPSEIKGKKTVLYFDTGSSAYPLLTDKQTAESLSLPGAGSSQYSVRSWNRSLTATTFKTNDSISIASKKIPIKKVTYMQGASDTQIAQMMKMGIGGMTGNKLFIGSILVLDTKNKKFGLLN